MEAFDLDINTNSAAPPAPVGVPGADGSPDAVPAAAPAINPFADELVSQKAAAAATVGLLLQQQDDPFQAPPFNNGHTNGLYDFLDDIARNGNGKAAVTREEDDDDDDEDSGPENVDGGADAKHASLLARNPFGEDLELQRQQTSEFDPENEPRHDTPTPPADEVPVGLGLVTDNVAESGEESEDEWNYYRVDPKEKPEVCAEKEQQKVCAEEKEEEEEQQQKVCAEEEQQTKQAVCPEQPLKGEEETDENMESQLNPNAAEFIPSPTHNMPSMEEILSKSQNVSSKEESPLDDSSFNNTFSSVKTTDLLASEELLACEEKELVNHKLLPTSPNEAVNPFSVDSNAKVEELVKEVSTGLNESTAFSTKAEFGDESVSSSSDFQKILDTSSNDLESSYRQDFLASGEKISGIALENSSEPSVVEQESVLQHDFLTDFQKEPVHISFELQKEIAPQMESEPERVKVDSDDLSPILEPEVHNVNALTENKIDDVEFAHNNMPIEVALLEDFTQNSNIVSQNVADLENVKESIATNVEDKIEAADSSRDDSDFLVGVDSKLSLSELNMLEFAKVVEKVESEDISALYGHLDFQGTESKVEIPSQFSESSLSELTDELPVQQETTNQLSNEISTPEYEKLEKDLEASEQYQDKFNTAEENIPKDFSPVIGGSLSNTSDVLLVSAHPDKELLLDDACAESVPSEIISVDSFSVLSNGPLSAPVSDLLEPTISENVTQSVPDNFDIRGDLIQAEAAQITENDPEVEVPPVAALEIHPLDTETTTEIASQDCAIVEQSSIIEEEKSPVHIPPSVDTHPESVPIELSETAQAPPPTPLITELGEREHLSFGTGTENFSEVVEKLSVAQQSEEQDCKDTFDVMPVKTDITSEGSIDDQNVLSQQIVEDSETSADLQTAPVSVPELEKEPTNETTLVESEVLTDAAVAGAMATAAAVTTAAAISASNEKDVKKEKDVTVKKLAAASAKDKKPGIERPKAATKTAVSSRLSATAAKPKSPTSPVKAPVSQKTASHSTTAPKPQTMTNKPLSKPPVTKTPTRPLSSSAPRPATTVASKPKPTGVQKPTSAAVGLTKTRPTSSSLEKKTVTNGDIKATKRPEQLTAKTTTTSPKPLSRPATAPVTKTTSRTVSSVSSVAKTKTALNGPSKPKTSPSVPSVRSVAKVSNEKEIKETANKQISTRTTTSTVRSTTTTTASKISVTSASRKIESKVIANGKGPASKPSGITKSTTTTTTTLSSRVAPKKPATTRVKATKTESIVEKSETVQGSKTVIAMNE